MADEKISFHLDMAEKRSELGEFSQDAPCPHCGGATESGFGMAGGGFGVYAYCQSCALVTSKSEVDE